VKSISELDSAAAAELGIKNYPGYTGAFTRRQASGAIDNGTTVVKVSEDKGDAHPLGSEGAVLGSIAAGGLGILYFIEWDATPGVAVAVAEVKVRPR